MSGDAPRLLEVAGLSKTFGGLRAVDNASFEVADGEILGLLGPNGSGKTTVFNLIAGALRVDGGRVLFSGRDITRETPSFRTRLGIARTFQLVRPLPNLTTLDNVLVARLYGRGRATAMRPARDESLDLLYLMGLSQKAGTLANGLTLAERKRLEIARALAGRPRLLLLDEPLGGLASGEVTATLAQFRQIRTEGITVVIVEHNVHAVRSLCDRLIVLNSGRIIAEGIPGEVLSRPEVIEVYLGKDSKAALQ